MPVDFHNFSYSFKNKRGKPVFVPTERGFTIGYEVKERVEAAIGFDGLYFHFLPGGHVAALHKHRGNNYFARSDLHNFFYSISRNRVARALHDIAIPKAGYYAKWSCVKNPYATPSYALPYGFVQSPVLATLVFAHSPLGDYLKDIQAHVTVSVYMDDIAISSNDLSLLEDVFTVLQGKIVEANFQLNLAKTVAPSSVIELFNCDLELNRTAVTDERIAAFYGEPKDDFSKAGFERYCRSVVDGNREP